MIRGAYDEIMGGYLAVTVIIYLVMLGLSIAYIVWFIRSMNAVKDATEMLTSQMVTLSKQIAQIASFVRPDPAVTPSAPTIAPPPPAQLPSQPAV